MRRSDIFWNLMIIVLELLVGWVFFGNAFWEYCSFVFGLVHSLILVGECDAYRREDEFQPLYCFISPLGVIFMALGLFIFTIMKILESKFNPIRPISRWITKFNKWLDREK